MSPAEAQRGRERLLLQPITSSLSRQARERFLLSPHWTAKAVVVVVDEWSTLELARAARLMRWLHSGRRRRRRRSRCGWNYIYKEGDSERELEL